MFEDKIKELHEERKKKLKVGVINYTNDSILSSLLECQAEVEENIKKFKTNLKVKLNYGIAHELRDWIYDDLDIVFSTQSNEKTNNGVDNGKN